MFAIYIVSLTIGIGIFLSTGKLTMGKRILLSVAACGILCLLGTVAINKIGDKPREGSRIIHLEDLDENGVFKEKAESSGSR